MHNLYTISNFLRFIPKLAVILTCSRFDYDITPDDKRVLYTYNKRAWSTTMPQKQHPVLPRNSMCNEIRERPDLGKSHHSGGTVLDSH